MEKTATGNEVTNETTVSKADFDKLASQNADLSKSLDGLKGQLLDTDYLSYLESKKAGAAKPAVPASGNPNNLSVASLTLEQLQQVIAAQVGHAFNEFGKPIFARLNNLDARQEVETVREKYADFEEFKDQVVSILESTPNTELNIEQAYLIAKANAINAGEASANGEREQKEEKAPQGGEKPGGTVPLPGETAHRFKNPEEAGAKAWAEVRERHGLTGDTI